MIRVFANGAVTGAFVQAFNHGTHEGRGRNESRERPDRDLNSSSVSEDSAVLESAADRENNAATLRAELPDGEFRAHLTVGNIDTSASVWWQEVLQQKTVLSKLSIDVSMETAQGVTTQHLEFAERLPAGTPGYVAIGRGAPTVGPGSLAIRVQNLGANQVHIRLLVDRVVRQQP